MWYLCPGGQTESNYTRTVWLMCLSCDSGAMPRIWVLEVSLSTCTELQHCCLQRFFFGDGADPSMAADFSEPRAAQPDPSVSTCCTTSHVVLCRSRCLVFQSCPHAMVCPLAPLQKEKEESKKRRQKKTKATRKNRERKKKRTWKESSLASARVAKEGNTAPIGQQVLLLQCVSDVVSMPWWPD